MSRPKHGDPYGAMQIIERDMALWNARLRAAAERPAVETGAQYRFLTISRKIGSLGDALADELSEALGWTVFDREIVAEIARNSHVRDYVVQQLDERGESLLQDTLQRLLWLAEEGSFGLEEYHEALLKTFGYLAKQGRAIIVGRGANFALRGEQGGLHIRVVASEETRARRLAARWDVAEQEARTRMKARDSERRQFIRQHFKQDIENVRFYDAVFNTDWLTTGQVVSCIASMTGSTPVKQ
jgi:hypothetical protein